MNIFVLSSQYDNFFLLKSNFAERNSFQCSIFLFFSICRPFQQVKLKPKTELGHWKWQKMKEPSLWKISSEPLMIPGPPSVEWSLRSSTGCEFFNLLKTLRNCPTLSINTFSKSSIPIPKYQISKVRDEMKIFELLNQNEIHFTTFMQYSKNPLSC